MHFTANCYSEITILYWKKIGVFVTLLWPIKCVQKIIIMQWILAEKFIFVENLKFVPKNVPSRTRN